MPHPVRRFLLGAPGAVLLAAAVCCPVRAAEAPSVTAEASISADADADATVEAWRETFDDPALVALLAEALERNLTIENARHRLQQARALQRSARDDDRPGADLFGAPLQDVPTGDGYYQLGIGTRWEFDFFGAGAARDQEAAAKTATVAAQLRAAQLMIAAAVIQAYYEHHQAQVQLALSRQSHDLALRAQRLTQARHDAGLADAGEVRAASMQEYSRRIEQARLKHQIDRASSTLAALLSQSTPAPRDARASGHFAAVRFPSALRADDLRRRPDLMVAEADVLEAAARVKIARAALYPSLKLVGSIGYTHSLSSAPSPGGIAPVIGPTIDIPLWDWGRRRAVVNSEDHALSGALALYRQSVIDAASEAHIALGALDQQQAVVATRRETVDALQQSLDAWTTRYDLGLASELDLIQPEADLLDARSALVGARLDSILALLSVYKAAGGPTPNPASGETP